MIGIRNKKQLIENGQTELAREARTLALESIEYAINYVSPKNIITSQVLLKDHILQVQKHTFNLSLYKRVYVIGGGKAAGPMAQALEEILGKHITAGTINVPYGCSSKTRIIKLQEASHPLPDQASIDGTRQMLEIAERAEADDLVIFLVSGGGSSLMSYPQEGISIYDKRKLTIALLRSGATINEINTVRKHISGFKGGWLAKKAYPATVLNLILSDVIGDSLGTIASGPTVPDPTTFADAKKVLDKYGLYANSPPSTKKVLSDGEQGAIEETPKVGDKVFSKVFSVVVGNNRTASLALCEYLRSKGLNTFLLSATLEGEARCIGTVLSSVANEICTSHNPASKPVAIVAGGETTVKVTGKGLGGRNQELALSAALKIKNNGDFAVALASVCTDGVDGPTDAAGAIVDQNTFIRAAAKGLSAESFLGENDSYNFFSKLGDLIFTGQTGTNVSDISLIIVL